MRELEERIEKVQRDLRATVLEAEDLYEKARSALGRVVKRQQVTLGSPGPAESPPPDDRPPGIDPISWAIQQRRKRRVGPTNGA